MYNKTVKLLNCLVETSCKEEVLRIAAETGAIDTNADLVCFYGATKESGQRKYLRLLQIGYGATPKDILPTSEIIQFTEDSKESMLILSRREHPFIEILLTDEMESGIVLPLITNKRQHGVFIFNSKKPYFFTGQKLDYLEAFRSITTRIYIEKGKQVVESSSKNRRQ